MPPGIPPPLPPPDPHAGNPSIRTLTESIHSRLDASADVNMDTATEDSPAPATSRQQPQAPPPEEFPLLNFFRALRADPNRRSETGTLNLDATTEALLLQLIESEARRSSDLKLFTEELRGFWVDLLFFLPLLLFQATHPPEESYSTVSCCVSEVSS
ncbi:uncharacterized protein PGTG_21467 [Puccinia graminis f. sp. tritici CRL 75-36-700-3]|uniref:Uncharacterized protein n=1 Tax=Puccinia graminis f. sp. tritici (strain CRL 75-36-700-3 / race SCCL) TaxID=418459 RepID=H6QRU9_PUCGT|nr:uncharacterized protein PGTG_21467 [Puccinia graminis f. sp. tritici CRL 75-36-700-3]EHS63391.1 hypothetical protein PGTG_21467 [Puccinia graminis f. sp. tritici CRL 75-36-700-3]